MEQIPPLSSIVVEETDKYKHKEIAKWDDFDIKSDLLRGIYAYGFENPSEIQKRAIQPIIERNDVIAQAQSGSGKTGTFAISALQTIDTLSHTTQALILAPTHELAKQIAGVIVAIGSKMDGLLVKTIVGGSSIQEDAAEMRKNPPHVVVGCAGRIYDMLMRRHINPSNIKLFILDEADELLSQGFKEQIYNIFQFFNEDIQVALFSATMPDEILTLSNKFMRTPVRITMKKEDLNLECIQQYYIALDNDHMKFETLKDLFSAISIAQCIIYCNSVKRVVDLQHAMLEENFSVCAIHSSMDKSERERALQQFRLGSHRVLISSNLTARGIDVQQVSTVINFDIPRCVHTYLHRIGRSGRWGRKGLAINFVTRQDVHFMRKTEQHYKITIGELPSNFSV
jgi:translation initiation factor 4A